MIPTSGPSAWANARLSGRDGKTTAGFSKGRTLRGIVAYMRPLRTRITVLLSLVVLNAAVAAVAPILIRHLVDDGLIARSSTAVSVFAALLGGFAVYDVLGGLAQRYLCARIGEDLILDIRVAVFGHIQRMPLAFFGRTPTGALVSRLNSDVLGAQQAFTSTFIDLTLNSITIVLVSAVMATMSWQIALLSLVVLPFLMLPTRRLGRKLHVLIRDSMRLNAELGALATERFGIGGSLLVRLFGRPAAERAVFASKAAQVGSIGVRTAVVNQLLLAIASLGTALSVAGVYFIGGRLVLGDDLTVGSLLAMTALLGRLSAAMIALSNARADIISGIVSFQQVFEVLRLQPAIRDAPDALPLPSPLPQDTATVEFRKVSFRYPPATETRLPSLQTTDPPESAPNPLVLHNISFRVGAGELVALVGPSGAGKTTITQLVPRLYDVTEGAVYVGGHDVRGVTLSSLQEAVGVVTQEAHLFHDTIRANLCYARPQATDGELWAACEAAQIADVVAALPDRFDTLVGDHGYRMSGGERQRVAIARLLLRSPSIVILDEATAHLDSESEVAVQRALAVALAGRTSLVIAHRLSTVQNADQIIVINEGSIVERGTHDQLVVAGGLYTSLYAAQHEKQLTRGLPEMPPSIF